jgi:hypothetical protein
MIASAPRKGQAFHNTHRVVTCIKNDSFTGAPVRICRIDYKRWNRPSAAPRSGGIFCGRENPRMCDSMLGLASRFARRYFGVIAAAMWMAVGMITVQAAEESSRRGRRSPDASSAVSAGRTGQRTLPEPNYDVLGSTELRMYSARAISTCRSAAAPSTVYAPVRLPYGATVEGLPINWRVIEIDGKTYYRNGSNFFRRVDRTGEVAFRIARPPAGVGPRSRSPAQQAYKQGDSTFPRGRRRLL